MNYEQYLSDRVLNLKPSGIRRFFDLAAQMDDILSLSIGEPDFDTPLPIIQAGIRSLEKGETHYTGNAGRIELREALAIHLEKLHHVRYKPEGEIFLTVGGSEGLYVTAAAFLNPGDEIIIPTPCFVSYQGVSILADAKIVEVATTMENNFDLDPKEIEKAITPKTKAILLGFPSNPTGAVASREMLLEVARLAEEHDLIVISDEMYDQIIYDGEHICFSTLPNMWERTILLGGFSKDFAMTGWRIGYACGPKPLIEKMLFIHQYMIMCVNTTAQDAAIEALQIGQEYVYEMVEEYKHRRDYIFKRLTDMGLPMVKPSGAFYAFPNISHSGLSSMEFCEQFLKEEKVAIVPGDAFGDAGKGFVRICYANSMENITEAMNRLEHFLQKFK
ncbi:MAG: aminotransferase class I/II-fold pyridoxal phosphate-dependent enzyme [Anaerolineaceae bacterium]|nr:aminotransferase class I/II-fold pyridoxal phosphate-dependent enzyme [Anaerolineaceae bacterium]